jgi:hypothetical protein
MKMFKFEVYVLDLENEGIDDAIYHIQNMKYCHAKVLQSAETDVGEWHDDHELNKRASIDTYKKYFD